MKKISHKNVNQSDLKDKNICITLDKNFLLPSMVMFESLFKNSGTLYTIHIIVDDKSWKGYLLLQSFIKKRGITCFLYEVNKEVISLYAKDDGRYTKAVYYILFLSSILPKSIDRILFLDCDLIIFSSIDEIFNLDISNFELAGSDNLVSKEFKEKLGILDDGLYVNSGVLYINLAIWRDKNIEKEFIRVIQNDESEIVYADQCIINIVCRNILFLNDKWNAKMDYTNAWKYGNLEGVIIGHALGRNKPWNNSKHPLKNQYFDFLRLNLSREKKWAMKRNALLNINRFLEQKQYIKIISELLFLVFFPMFPKFAKLYLYNYTKSYNYKI